jgi:hypothetical protein
VVRRDREGDANSAGFSQTPSQTALTANSGTLDGPGTVAFTPHCAINMMTPRDIGIERSCAGERSQRTSQQPQSRLWQVMFHRELWQLLSGGGGTQEFSKPADHAGQISLSSIPLEVK